MSAGAEKFSRAELEERSFRGWPTFAQLREAAFESVPAATPGVYVVLRPGAGQPRFTPQSIGGWFKGQDPAVDADALARNWVEGASVVYIGKADWRKRGKHPLRKRLQEFADFGAGRPVAHWGGRLIWQLEDAAELLVGWMPTPDESARAVEVRLIEEFRELHGRAPFANEPHLG